MKFGDIVELKSQPNQEFRITQVASESSAKVQNIFTKEEFEISPQDVVPPDSMRHFGPFGD